MRRRGRGRWRNFRRVDTHVVHALLAGFAAVARHGLPAAVCVLPALVPHGCTRGAVLGGVHVRVLADVVAAGVVLAHNKVLPAGVRTVCDPTPNALGLGPRNLSESKKISRVLCGDMRFYLSVMADNSSVFG